MIFVRIKNIGQIFVNQDD